VRKGARGALDRGVEARVGCIVERRAPGREGSARSGRRAARRAATSVAGSRRGRGRRAGTEQAADAQGFESLRVRRGNVPPSDEDVRETALGEERDDAREASWCAPEWSERPTASTSPAAPASATISGSGAGPCRRPRSPRPQRRRDTFAPRSWPSSPTFATSTRSGGRRAGRGGGAARAHGEGAPASAASLLAAFATVVLPRRRRARARRATPRAPPERAARRRSVSRTTRARARPSRRRSRRRPSRAPRGAPRRAEEVVDPDAVVATVAKTPGAGPLAQLDRGADLRRTPSAPSRSDWLTTRTSPASRRPLFIACTPSPWPGATTTTTVSATGRDGDLVLPDADRLDDDGSKPAASEDVGDVVRRCGHAAEAPRARASGRRRPRRPTARPCGCDREERAAVKGLVGSTATMPTLLPPVRMPARAPRRASTSRRPAARDADAVRAPDGARQRREEREAVLAAVLDERDRARDRARLRARTASASERSCAAHTNRGEPASALRTRRHDRTRPLVSKITRL